jgi:hypothetical protein
MLLTVKIDAVFVGAARSQTDVNNRKLCMSVVGKLLA